MRIVLDTNVLVSAFLNKHGIPNLIVSAWEGGTYRLVTSEEQLSELDRVLHYDKLSKRISPEEASELIARMRISGHLAENLPVVNYSKDPDDNLLIATAIKGKADMLVTGDQNHPLHLGVVEGIPIVSPRDALKSILPSTEI